MHDIGTYAPALVSASPVQEESVISSPSGRTAMVDVQDVAVRFGERIIWQQATFTIAEGDFVAIVGPNGAGKSTFLRLLLGFIRPDRGKIQVLGKTPRRGNREIGYVPQRRTLDQDMPVRGRDLVMLGLDGLRWGFSFPGPTRRREHALVDEIIEAVDASMYANRPIGQLSGGELQRLLLAQALVSRPRLLFLDEPLASLDLRSQVSIVQLTARLARERGITVLLVTHDINPLLPVISHVLYIARGQTALGRPAEIVTTERLSALYQAPVEVVRDSQGRMFVVGLENAEAHTDCVEHE